MRIIAKVLDPNSYSLLGFLVTGKPKEFMTREQRKALFDSKQAPSGPDKVNKIMTFAEMIAMGFSNAQLKVVNGSFVTVGNFDLNKLPAISPDGKSVNDTIELKERLTINGNTAGFTAILCGNTTKRLRYSDIVQLSTRLNPTNFFVRHIHTKGPDGKMIKKPVIVGKAGMALEDLPEVPMKGAEKKPKDVMPESMPPKDEKLEKKFKEIVEQAEKKKKPALLGLVELFDWLNDTYNKLGIEKKTGVYLVKFPDDEYKATTNSTKTTSDEFIHLGLPEIGEVQLDYGLKKLNANVLFKKVGVVMVNGQPVYTFTYSKKSVFESGKPHLGRFGIAIEADRANELFRQFGVERFTKEVTDEKQLKAVHAITGNPALRILEVYTQELELMKEPTILDKRTLVSTAVSLEMLKETQKITDNVLKQIDELMKQHYGEEKTAQMAGLPVNLRLYEGNDEMLRAISASGISLKTGAFEKTKEVGLPEEDSVVTQKESVSGVQIEYIPTHGKKDYKADLEALYGTLKTVEGQTELAEQENNLHLLSKEVASIASTVYGLLQNYKAAIENKDAVTMIVGKGEDVSTLQSLKITAQYIKYHTLRLKRVLWVHKVGLFNKGGLSAVVSGFEQTKSLKNNVNVYTPVGGLEEGYDVRIKARG